MEAQAEGRKAIAERDALLSLAAILTHDLSNPLQSITVLCELGMEDDDPAEGPRRAQQSLQAAERMRDLLHAYAALVRNVDRKTKVAAALERTAAMFRRRCERHRITLAIDVAQDFDGPRATGLGLVSLFLGLVRVAEENSGPFQADFAVDGPVTTITLRGAEGAVAPWPADAIERIDDALADEGSATFDGGTVELRLESSAS